MNVCPKCGSPIEEGGAFCRNCGFSINNAAPQQPPMYQQPAMQQPPMYQQTAMQQPAYDPKDHTAEFDADEVAKNKFYASLAYLLGAVGVVIALLIGQKENSEYLAFHAKQGAKLAAATTLCTLIPVLGWLAAAALFIVSVICFFKTNSGKSVEAPIVSSIELFK
ncbi:MAG: hypothetical protein E7536_07660 [Ruminococcaceae bacterium]|nr:hypothetical protein [Oscillospiraceae bacterium]